MMTTELLSQYEEVFRFLPLTYDQLGFDGLFVIIDNSNGQDVLNFVNYRLESFKTWKLKEIEDCKTSLTTQDLTKDRSEYLQRTLECSELTIIEYQEQHDLYFTTKKFAEDFISSSKVDFENYIRGLIDIERVFRANGWGWKSWQEHIGDKRERFIFKNNERSATGLKLFVDRFINDIFKKKVLKRVRKWNRNSKYSSFYDNIYYLFGETYIFEFEDDSNLYVFCIGAVD
jgi:hypothetical protein